MKVVLVHYHLRCGGVTSIIKSIASFLERLSVDYLILVGEASAELKERYPLEVLPALGYDQLTQENEISKIVEKAQMIVKNHLGEGVVWHFHNHALGKNFVFPSLVAKLALIGEKLLLEIHDFAEDGRSSNYAVIDSFPLLYPQAEHIFYAVINSRDFRHLREAGCHPKNLIYLPNLIEALEISNETVAEEKENYVLYPVRGIRRKNLGELLLWSLLVDDGTNFVITSGVENPKWQEIYQQWVEVAKQLEAPVIFEGRGLSFENWLSKATHIMTTSVAEGFGMLYINAPALNKPLWGRDLIEITEDFKKVNKTLFQDLYQYLWIPIEWIGRKRWEKQLEKEAETYYRNYKKPLNRKSLEQLKELFSINDKVDYGNLPEVFQIEILEKIKKNPALRAKIIVELEHEIKVPAPMWIKQVMEKKKVNINATNLVQHFSAEAFEGKLMATYQRLLATKESKVSELDPKILLNQFLKLQNFHFLRTY